MIHLLGRPMVPRENQPHKILTFVFILVLIFLWFMFIGNAFLLYGVLFLWFLSRIFPEFQIFGYGQLKDFSKFQRSLTRQESQKYDELFRKFKSKNKRSPSGFSGERHRLALEAVRKSKK